jgi:hypothetical protein
MNTKISYMYTCAANYKDHTAIVVSGEFSDNEKQQLLSQLGDGSDNGFIPHLMNLGHLSVVLGDSDGDMQEAIDQAEDEASKESIKEYDHPWHKITLFELTNEEPDTKYSAESFLAKLRELNYLK